jgi:diaminopimelate decarboxylase
MKRTFATKDELEQIAARYPTPFHLYDEKGMRANARALLRAFSWNPGFKQYFAVKANPNPTILKILRQEGCGVDCSSLTELLLAQKCGFSGGEIMFSSNNTPAEEFVLASKLGATINLDDITHIEFLRDLCGIPETISCRYNPAEPLPWRVPARGFMYGHPGDAKYALPGRSSPKVREGRRIGRQTVRNPAFFWPPTPFPTITTPPLPAFYSVPRWSCAMRPGARSPSSIFRAGGA